MIPERAVIHRYGDPLDVIWTQAAGQIGMHLSRDSEVFAAWSGAGADGTGILRIGTVDTLDPDDSLAQMIFHEMCHGLIEGPAAFSLADWGLDITDRGQLVHEHAALRLQCALAAPHGLRQFFASTTAARGFYDSLPTDPLLIDDSPDPTAVPRDIQMARCGFQRATQGPWAEMLRNVLTRTAMIVALVSQVCTDDSLYACYRQP